MKPNTLAEASKKISELIARSWLSEGEEIKQTLLEGNSDRIKKLFESNDIDLDKLFSPMSVKIAIDRDGNSGSIEQIASKNGTVTVKIPYPSRPDEVTDEQLNLWSGNNIIAPAVST